MKDIFEIGIIASAHGIKGEVKIFPYSNMPENFRKQKYFLYNGKKLYVKSVKLLTKFVVVKFNGVDTIEDAQAMKGIVISIEKENAAPLGENEYYMKDIIGCGVYENDNYLGDIKDIIETGGNDVYSVIDHNKREILIPALKNVIKKIDIGKKIIHVILPEGLLDDDYF